MRKKLGMFGSNSDAALFFIEYMETVVKNQRAYVNYLSRLRKKKSVREELSRATRYLEYNINILCYMERKSKGLDSI